MDNEQERLHQNGITEKSIEYFYESAQARSERTIKRLIIALIMTIILLFLSNVIWIREWAQYDYSSEEIIYSQDGKGLNSINWGTQGDLINGTSSDCTEAEASP